MSEQSTAVTEQHINGARRIGFLIPEFPGQTHIFLWRERQALQEIGVSVDLISTRRPNRAIAPHSWTAQAEAETEYLLPLGAMDTLRAMGEVARSGPGAWWRVLRAVVDAKDLSAVQRIRLLATTLLSAKLILLSRSQGWNHLNVHSCAESAHVAMLAWLLGRLPYSLTLHGPTLHGYGPNQPQKWRYAKFAIVISQKLLKTVNTDLAAERPETVVVAPMGVDLETIRRSRPYEAWQPGTPFRIFSCGRLNFVKGHNYLIDAVAALRRLDIDVQLEIAGEDELGGKGYRQVLVEQIETLGLGGCVRLLGAVSEQTIRQGLEQAHAFVIASLDEGISVAIMEAMAMAMPVIATDVGGNSELIDSGVNAIMVPAKDTDALVRAVASLMDDPAFAARLAQTSRSKIEQAFHHRVSARAMARCLAETAPE